MSAELFGINIDTFSFKEALERAEVLLNNSNVSQIVTINPEMIEYAGQNKDFATIVNESDMVIPDGVGVKIALKINGVNVERIPGIDFARKLLEVAAVNNLPVAIVGAKQEVIQKAVNNLRNEITGLNIVYYHDGYFESSNDIYEELIKYSPKLILVATGSPKQEHFIYDAKKLLKPALMIGIGGSLDVWSGMVKRAPKIFQIFGLEWLYRTICQPERFKRIFPTLPLFIIKALKYKFSK